MKREKIILTGMYIILFFAIGSLVMIAYDYFFFEQEIVTEADSDAIILESAKFSKHDNFWYWSIRGVEDINNKREYSFRIKYNNPVTSYGIQEFEVRSNTINGLSHKIENLRILIESGE